MLVILFLTLLSRIFAQITSSELITSDLGHKLVKRNQEICGIGKGRNIYGKNGQCTAYSTVIRSNEDYQLELAVYGERLQGWQCTMPMGIPGSALSKTTWTWQDPSVKPHKLLGAVFVRHHKPTLLRSIRYVIFGHTYQLQDKAMVGIGWQMVFTSGQAGHISLEVLFFSNSQNVKAELMDGYQSLPDLVLRGGSKCEVYAKIVAGSNGRVYPKYIFALSTQYQAGSSVRGDLLSVTEAIRNTYGLPEDATWLDTVVMRAQMYSTPKGTRTWWQLECVDLEIQLY